MTESTDKTVPDSEDLDDFYGTLPTSIANALKVALSAVKKVDQTFRCSKCGHNQRVRAKVQDSTAALRAAELWTSFNLAKPAPEKPESQREPIIFTRKVVYTCDRPELHEQEHTRV